MSSERRRSARVQIMKHVGGTTVPLRNHLRVLEMSIGGMLIETTAELSPIGVHDFRLQLSDGRETLVRGRIVHGRFAVQQASVKFTLGIEFSFMPIESVEVLRRFINETKPDPFPMKPTGR